MLVVAEADKGAQRKTDLIARRHHNVVHSSNMKHGLPLHCCRLAADPVGTQREVVNGNR